MSIIRCTQSNYMRMRRQWLPRIRAMEFLMVLSGIDLNLITCSWQLLSNGTWLPEVKLQHACVSLVSCVCRASGRPCHYCKIWDAGSVAQQTRPVGTSFETEVSYSRAFQWWRKIVLLWIWAAACLVKRHLTLLVSKRYETGLKKCNSPIYNSPRTPQMNVW